MAYPTTTPRRPANAGSGNLNVPYSIGMISGSFAMERQRGRDGRRAQGAGEQRREAHSVCVSGAAQPATPRSAFRSARVVAREGGIRTRDGLPRTAFPVRRHSPLGDLSPDAQEPAVGAGRFRRTVCLAERVGFEPTLLSQTAFRERHHQPLGHLSAREDTKRVSEPRSGRGAVRPHRGGCRSRP